MKAYDSPMTGQRTNRSKPGVRLTIRGDGDSWLDLLTSGDKGSRDDGVVGLAKDTDGTEEVLSGSLESVEETTDLVCSARCLNRNDHRKLAYLVGGHEDLCQLLVVLEVHSPDGETLAVESRAVRTCAKLEFNRVDSLLVEPLQSIRGVQVGVLPLPLLEVESRLW